MTKGLKIIYLQFLQDEIFRVTWMADSERVLWPPRGRNSWLRESWVAKKRGWRLRKRWVASRERWVAKREGEMDG
jgi:hypothetical protein